MNNRKNDFAFTFLIWFGKISLVLFCVSAALLVIEIYFELFPVNPIYLLMLAIGFLGMLLTDIVAERELRKIIKQVQEFDKKTEENDKDERAL